MDTPRPAHGLGRALSNWVTTNFTLKEPRNGSQDETPLGGRMDGDGEDDGGLVEGVATDSNP